MKRIDCCSCEEALSYRAVLRMIREIAMTDSMNHLQRTAPRTRHKYIVKLIEAALHINYRPDEKTIKDLQWRAELDKLLKKIINETQCVD
jgi:hypothetical protein